MKRSILALFLAAVLVVSLTACGGSKESDNSAKNADVTVSEKQESGTESNSAASVNAAGEQSTGVSAAGVVRRAARKYRPVQYAGTGGGFQRVPLLRLFLRK